MIKLHGAADGEELWLNEKYIQDIIPGDKFTDITILPNVVTYHVTETPEEILALMGETTKPAPVKNNITKWLENVDSVFLESFVSDLTCLTCPVNDRCCEYGLTECAEALKRWALEISE